ncbi:IAA-alanine resistance protein 1 isoform X2 [Sorghum bicolor]|uniref:IAA-alanine resistance protein 1 isoform X2 n=1 Tax=Sorghum bicolor TaxID=4558 RepID=UPI000B424279|nr:IAA-alanine resistance protein 1 isoform X2 [Sorghum bicolor]|eukprot:XP_021320918.1 IAA-alanine resistance protein 1 isoform X2 [Sorghum bicolor]
MAPTFSLDGKKEPSRAGKLGKIISSRTREKKRCCSTDCVHHSPSLVDHSTCNHQRRLHHNHTVDTPAPLHRAPLETYHDPVAVFPSDDPLSIVLVLWNSSTLGPEPRIISSRCSRNWRTPLLATDTKCSTLLRTGEHEAGAMLGDSFLHQLPHAFGGGHSHSHDHEGHDHAHEHAHAHSLEDLSVGLSILFGIVLFFIVEKIVRYVEDNSQNGTHSMGHGHHHHNHKRHDSSDKAKLNHQKSDTDGKDIDHTEEEPLVDGATGKISDGHESKATIRKRSSSKATDGESASSESDPAPEKASSNEGSSISNSNLVFGYLNLFSDGVHNFTDGMALGSAFLLHGSVGGWSRTLFLLAHELPQEVGDFGILVRSGFTVSKALFFNFLSALVALAGTALALSLGKDPGHSSLIEGFTAGGFIYIAVAGVLPQMNDQKTTLRSSVAQLISLSMGMLVALGISLVE